MHLFSWFSSLNATWRRNVSLGMNDCENANERNAIKDIDQLPAVIRKYLATCGYVKDSAVAYCSVKWAYAELKPKPGGQWRSINCKQINFIEKPGRVAYMKAKLFGFIPLGALDTFIDKKGSMVIKLLGFITVSKTIGPKMDAAELVTILAEAIMIPQYFLQPFIQLTEISPKTIKATISNGSSYVSGTFYFNEYDEFLRFETNDRYFNNNGKLEKIKWTTYAWNYKTRNGITFPANYMAKWHLPAKDHIYFKGKVDELVMYR